MATKKEERDRVVSVMITEAQKERLIAGASRYGQALAPWLLSLGLREAAGTFGFGEKLEAIRPRRIAGKGQKRTSLVTVRMTDSQKDEIARRADYLGVPLSTWLLMLGLIEAEPIK